MPISELWAKIVGIFMNGVKRAEVNTPNGIVELEPVIASL